MLPLRAKQVLSMLTRDRVRLDADVYAPEAPGPWPVLLMRQPYGRAIASTVVYAHPSWYAAQGYMVVIQDVRGRGSSEGEFRLFDSEIEDGEDAVSWAAQLPNSSGQVGMYGFSYQGMTQLFAAVNQPPALKTICPAMVAYDLYQDWAYEGGAFCLQTNLAWALQLSAETVRRQGDRPSYQRLYEAARQLPFGQSVPVDPEILRSLDSQSFYHQWLQQSQPSEYWEVRSPRHYLDRLTLPMLHIGGWFDAYLRGSLRLYEAMVKTHPAHRQQLVVGPWAHLPWGRRAGDLDFGASAVTPCDALQLAWFNHHLKGEPWPGDVGDVGDVGNAGDSRSYPAARTPVAEARQWHKDLPVRLFVMGINQWQDLPRWPIPEPAESCWFLTSTGLASLDPNSGALSQLSTGPGAQIIDVLVHDPWRPAPSLGGHNALPAGPVERSSCDQRSDVLTYTSLPLDGDRLILGQPVVTLFCAADAPSFDLSVVLSQVDWQGRAIALCQGHLRVNCAPNEIHEHRIPLATTALQIPARQALRLSISAASFPAYGTNPGTGALDAHLIEHRVMTLRVYSGGDYAACLHLPGEGVSDLKV
jgi:uncharacterized protein